MKIIFAVLLVSICTSAYALFRCEINGKVEYRDTPCPSGIQTKPKLINDAPTQVEKLRADFRLRREKLAIDEIRHKEKIDSEKRIRCDQLERSTNWTINTAAKYPNDEWWQNQALDAQQDYHLECRRN